MYMYNKAIIRIGPCDIRNNQCLGKGKMFFTVYVLGTCSFRLCKHKTEGPAICLFCACLFILKTHFK